VIHRWLTLTVTVRIPHFDGNRGKRYRISILNFLCEGDVAVIIRVSVVFFMTHWVLVQSHTLIYIEILRACSNIKSELNLLDVGNVSKWVHIVVG